MLTHTETETSRPYARPMGGSASNWEQSKSHYIFKGSSFEKMSPSCPWECHNSPSPCSRCRCSMWREWKNCIYFADHSAANKIPGLSSHLLSWCQIHCSLHRQENLLPPQSPGQLQRWWTRCQTLEKGKISRECLAHSQAGPENTIQERI